MSIIKGLTIEKMEHVPYVLGGDGPPMGGDGPGMPGGAPPMGEPGDGAPPMGGPGGEGGPSPMGAMFVSLPSLPSVMISDGAYVQSQTVSDNVLAGEITGSSAKGLNIVSEEATVGGITVSGCQYVIEDANIRLSGSNKGLGGKSSGVNIENGASVVMRNCDVSTNGAARCATAVSNNSILKAYDCKLHSDGAPFGEGIPKFEGFMMSPPAALEIDGNCRTHITMGNSESYFYNCTVSAVGWAALSTDIAGGNVYLEANDCKVITTQSGYGAYADGWCHDVFNRCDFEVASMAAIVAGESDATFNDCNCNCGTYFALMHCIGQPLEAGRIDVNGGTIKTKSPVLLIKSDNAQLNFKNVEVQTESGVFLHSIINDDPMAETACNLSNSEVYGLRLNLEDMKLFADIIHDDGHRNLCISMKNTTYRGRIKDAVLKMESSSWFATADSTVTFEGGVDTDVIDAPAGVTITAKAVYKGTYNLPSGGILNIN